MQPDGDPKTVWPMLEDIRARLIRVEDMLRQRTAVDVTHPLSALPTKNGKSANGMIVVHDVPPLEVILAAADKYMKRHGKDALHQAKNSVNPKVGKLSELNDEERAIFYERINDDPPEAKEE